jgi:hypothetical protein
MTTPIISNVRMFFKMKAFSCVILFLGEKI